MNGNTNLVLIMGKSASGKSMALRGLDNPEGVLYLNCENNKRLPFKSKFIEKTIVAPGQVYEAFIWAETQPNVHTIVIDTLTFLMDMYEHLIIRNSPNTMQAWGDYASFFRVLMADHVANSTKNIIFLAHSTDELNKNEMVMETLVKVKGSLMNQGIEAFFSSVISCKKMPTLKLEEYGSPMLDITPLDERLGYKHVFQTQPTKETIYERIRNSVGMWEFEETFIDNNVQHVIDRLHQYHDEP